MDPTESRATEKRGIYFETLIQREVSFFSQSSLRLAWLIFIFI